MRVSTSAPASALSSVAASIARFGDTIGSALASNAQSIPENTPTRTDKAIQRAVQNESEWLTEDQLVQLFEIFSNSKSAVTTYCAMDPSRSSLVRKWIRMKLMIPEPF